MVWLGVMPGATVCVTDTISGVWEMAESWEERATWASDFKIPTWTVRAQPDGSWVQGSPSLAQPMGRGRELGQCLHLVRGLSPDSGSSGVMAESWAGPCRVCRV